MRSIDKLVAQQGFIKDAQLDEYLTGKNLTRPDSYGMSDAAEVNSTYVQSRANLKADMEYRNKAAMRRARGNKK